MHTSFNCTHAIRFLFHFFFLLLCVHELRLGWNVYVHCKGLLSGYWLKTWMTKLWNETKVKCNFHKMSCCENFQLFKMSVLWLTAYWKYSFKVVTLHKDVSAKSSWSRRISFNMPRLFFFHLYGNIEWLHKTEHHLAKPSFILVISKLSF